MLVAASRQRVLRRRLVASLATVSLLGGCTSSLKFPDLGTLYDQAAQHRDANRNPIVVIPGILGSKLVDAPTKRVVWGAFTGDYANPKTPDGARLVALPMREGASLAELRDDVWPAGVLDKIKLRMFGLPLQLKAYLNILTMLGVGGYQDEDLALAGIDYGSDHYTCFQFDYDWRRDNVENAKRLHQFLLEKREYVRQETKKRFGVDKTDIKFDVVAHSMGGLLARYYLRYGDSDLPENGPVPEPTWKGAELLDRVVLVAPPNAGSVDALVQLIEGQKFGPFLPRYEPAVLGTFPSAYQLLPRARHRSVVFAGEPDEPVADLLEPELWQRMGWGLAAPDQDHVLATLLPETTDPGQRRLIALDHQRKALMRARQFFAALDRPASPPEHIRLYLVAGDAVPTDQLLEVDRATGAVTRTARGQGDGTVLRSSALMDERAGQDWEPGVVSPIEFDEVLFLFTDHLGLTKDAGFTDNVLYWLLEEPRR